MSEILTEVQTFMRQKNNQIIFTMESKVANIDNTIEKIVTLLYIKLLADQ